MGAQIEFGGTVTALAASDVWSGDFGVVRHWNGSAFDQEFRSNVDHLASDATAPDDVWMGGDVSMITVQPVIQHWDGSVWTDTPVPHPTTIDQIRGLDARTLDDAWAVGLRNDVRNGFIVRWNGTAWTEVPAPKTSAAEFLNDVSAVGPDDAWAVGARVVRSFGTWRPWILHWNGAKWRKVRGATLPGGYFELIGVHAVAADDVWAVGRAPGSKGLIEHWNGSSWTRVASPKGSRGAFLDVDRAGSELWISGGAPPRDNQHWARWATFRRNGAGWARVAMASLPTSGPDITPAYAKISTLADGTVFSPGAMLCPFRVDASGVMPADGAVQLTADAAWHAAPGSGTHRIEDPTGLTSLDSGVIPPGRMASASFDQAGTFTFRDRATGASGTVGVTPFISLTFDGRIRAEWAISLPRGTVADVQFLPPGASTWQDWRRGTSTKSGMRAPGGAGTFSVRARIRGGGVASGWSPPATVQVS